MKKTFICLAFFISMFISPSAGYCAYSDMNNFCITPPFIQDVIKPNLLLMIDNSSSMYDLAYADEGLKSGSTITRQPYYCYDPTFKTLVCSNNSLQSCTSTNVATVCGSGATCIANKYVGYFDSALNYSYDFTNKYFNTTASVPSSGCDKYLAGNLCVTFNNTTTPNTVSGFAASGNYLNWLTASKFDVEKKVLTGGKHDGTYLLPESRGCVGQGFIKDVLTGDFVNFATGATDPNSKLGLTFSVRGPIETANPSAPSQGGQTYLEIYRGTYNSANCQAAVDVWGSTTSSQPDVRDAVESCLNYNPRAANYCQSAPTMACTIDSNCYGTPVAARNGGCSNNASTACTTNSDCGTTTTPGACSNLDGKACLVSHPDCTKVSAGACSNQVKECETASECTIPGHLGACSNRATVSCSASSQCNFAQVLGTCSNRSTTTCTSDSNCSFAAVQGRCSIKHGTVFDPCSSNADCGTTQDPTKYGTCINPAPIPASSGTCQGYTAASSGSCIGYLPDNTGSCTGGATTYGTCNGVTTTPNTCSNPPYQAAFTPYYGPCINPDQSTTVKTKVTYSHTIQTCWSYFRTGAFANGDFSRLTTKCDEVFAGWGICSADNSKLCTADTDCSASSLGTCQRGPSSIRPGNPALVCSLSYVGQFCTWNSITNSCSNWDNGSPTSAQKDAAFAAFCDSQQSTVIDPTDAAASSPNLDKTPAILSGIGVEAQLGQPLGTLPVKIAASAPSGLVQQFAGQIRIGAMSFNQFGSGSESSSTAGAIIATPKVCSNNTTKLCSLDADCGGGTCGLVAAAQNLDGGRIIYPVGFGKCATMTSITCTSDAGCSGGNTCLDGFCGTRTSTDCSNDSNCTGANQVCNANTPGDHVTTGTLVKAIDDIRANAWTPFAEAFYETIGYYARTSSGTSRTDLRINSINPTSTDFSSAANAPKDYNVNLNPSNYKCQKNYTLLISDGSSTADQNADVSRVALMYSDASHANIAAGTCTNYLGSQNLPIMTWIGKNMKISDFAITGTATATPTDLTTLDARDTITSYVVFNGGSNGQTGACDSLTLLTNAATKGGTTIKTASKPEELSAALTAVFQEVAAQSSSGTAASILSNSEGSGATLLQALFYPKQEFDRRPAETLPSSTKWIGELQSFWYYLDPFLQKTSIREDTNSDYKLSLTSDKVVQFYFDNSNKKTLVNKYSDLNGDGAADSSTPDSGAAGIAPETVKSLWKAGRLLWERDVTATATKRTIFTGYNSTFGATPQKVTAIDTDGFVTSSTAWDLLQIPAGTDAERKARAVKLINYVHGSDQSSDTAPCVTSDCKYRSRKVYIDGCGLGDCDREWKLGDIVASTPKIASTIRINNYNLDSPTGYGDVSYANFVKSATYQTRGMAFVGANDGMLHAFKLGILKELSGANDKAQLNNADGTIATSASGLGQEAWAYIPKHTLPYLKYLAEGTYNHLFYVDKSPLILDASIGKVTKVCSNNPMHSCTDASAATDCGSVSASCVDPAGSFASCSTDYSQCPKVTDGASWRTILIGGTGLGGAGRPQTESHSTVKPPIASAGYSSYFALDVTDPATPKYLWEFFGNTGTDASPTPKLGFSTAGAAIVRIATSTDDTKNGKWFALFASGPLGPVDTNTHSFLGQSDQRLRLFVVDLATGALLRTIDLSSNPNLGLDAAFAGSMSNSTIDTDRSNKSSTGFYSDDAVYIGYTKKDTSTGTWTKGGVLRLLTKESSDPATWTVSKVIDDIGPVTTAVSKLQDRRNNKMWLLFGTGRFFYKGDDNSTTRHALYGVKEPCYSTANRTMQLAVAGGTYNDIDGNCTDSLSGTLVDQSGDSSAPATTLSDTAPGWKILLDGKTGRCANNSVTTCTTATADTVCGTGIACNQYMTERIITDPLAAPNGAVFFTSFIPSLDPCLFGGNSLLWAVNYATGSTPPASAMQGKALMQVSTGAFAEITLSDAFRNPGLTRYDGRRLATPITGVPPTAQGLSLFSNPPPFKKMLHVREK